MDTFTVAESSEPKTSQVFLAGQKAAARLVEPGDAELLTTIINSEDAKRYLTMDPNAEDITVDEVLEGIKTFIGNYNPDAQMYVVSGSIEGNRADAGELQGYIMLENDDASRLQSPKAKDIQKKLNLPTLDDTGFGAISLAYAKYPEAKPGQMSSGVRTVLYMFSQQIENISQEYLAKIVVVAYVKPENAESKNVLRACGFTPIPTEDEIDWSQEIWQLDWNKLFERIAKDAERAIEVK